MKNYNSKEGYNAQIFQWNLGNCSNKGISSKFTSVEIVPADTDPETAPKNAVCLHTRIAGNSFITYFVPLALKEKVHMSGGTFVYSSDCRFPFIGEPVDHPIALHDRTETPEQTAILSM